MKRRSFFGAMAAAGIGGKKVATDVLADVVGASPPTMPYMGGGQIAGSSLAGGNYLTQLHGQIAKMAALKAIGIPPIVRDVLRGWSNQQRANLDDINSLVSVSVSAKKRMIRERMEEHLLDEWLDGPTRSLKRELFNKEFGVDL